MAHKFKPTPITKPGIYEIRVYHNRVDKSGKVKSRYALGQHLKNVNVFLGDNDELMYREGIVNKSVDSLWGEHKTLQRIVKQ